MRRIQITLMLFFTCTFVYAQKINPFSGPKPIAVLIQTDPWLMAIGSDTPMVVIYDDGLIVYLKKEKENRSILLSKQLSTNELSTIRKKLSSLGDYSELNRYYDLSPHVTDLPETKIYLSLGDREYTTIVYGLMVSDTTLPAYTILDGDRKADKLPVLIKNLHAYLTSLDFADAKQWVPPYVEIMMWGYDHAPDESIHWPKDWPSLDSPNAFRRGESYSIFLPGKELPKLCEFLSTRKEKGAVEIHGKKFTISVRYTFPSEPVWSKAFKSKSVVQGETGNAINPAFDNSHGMGHSSKTGVSDSIIIFPNIVAGIMVGTDTYSDVIKKLGHPIRQVSSHSETTEQDILDLFYPCLGIEFTVLINRQMLVCRAEVHRPFTGSSKEGIGIGTPLDHAKKLLTEKFGKPDRIFEGYIDWETPNTIAIKHNDTHITAIKILN
jgi:hypothetical protein